MGTRWGSTTSVANNQSNFGIAIYPGTGASAAYEPLCPTELIDFTNFNYLIFQIWEMGYYAETYYVGYINKLNPTYSECVNAVNKQTDSHPGDGRNNWTCKQFVFDISNVTGSWCPFATKSSQMYSYCKYMYLTNSI